jgi:hypothetical protein
MCNSDGIEEDGTLALIHQTWFTPRKSQVWWPSYKTSAQFKKALFIEEQVDDKTWSLYDVKRIFFTCNDFNKANRKLKECEEFSDLQSTEIEEEIQNKKRKRIPNKKYVNTSSEDENNDNFDSIQPPSKLYKSVQLKDGRSKTQCRQNYVVAEGKATNLNLFC